MMKKLVSMMILGVTFALAPAADAAGRPARRPISEVRPDGDARLITWHERDVERSLIVVPVTIDLQDVTLDDRPAVLGAYVVKVEFDPKRVTYHGVSGGDDPYFATEPFATVVEKGNLRGVVRVSGVQTNALLPIGMVNVARLRFSENVTGGSDSIRLTLESVASALERDADGTYLRNLEIKTGKDIDQ